MQFLVAFLALTANVLSQTTPYTPTDNIYGYNYDSAPSYNGPSLVMNPNYKYLNEPLANEYAQSYANALQRDQVQRDQAGYGYGNSANLPVLSNNQQNQVNYQQIQRDQTINGQLSAAPYTNNYGSANNYYSSSSSYNNQYGLGYSSTNGPFYDVRNYQNQDTQFQPYQFQPINGGGSLGSYGYGTSYSGSGYSSGSAQYNPNQVLRDPTSYQNTYGAYQSQSDLKQTDLRNPQDPYLYYRDAPNPAAGLKNGEGPLLYQPSQGGNYGNYGSSNVYYDQGYGGSYAGGGYRGQSYFEQNFGGISSPTIGGSSGNYNGGALYSPSANSYGYSGSYGPAYSPYNYGPNSYSTSSGSPYNSQQVFYNPPSSSQQYESYGPVDAGNNQTEMYYPYRTTTNYNLPSAYTNRYNGGSTYGPFYDQAPNSGR